LPRPPCPTLFPYTRSSDLKLLHGCAKNLMDRSRDRRPDLAASLAAAAGRGRSRRAFGRLLLQPQQLRRGRLQLDAALERFRGIRSEGHTAELPSPAIVVGR